MGGTWCSTFNFNLAQNAVILLLKNPGSGDNTSAFFAGQTLDSLPLDPLADLATAQCDEESLAALVDTSLLDGGAHIYELVMEELGIRRLGLGHPKVFDSFLAELEVFET